MSKINYDLLEQEIARMDAEITEFFKQEEIIRKQSRAKKEELRQAIIYEQLNEGFLIKEVHKKIMADREKMSKLTPCKEIPKLSKQEEELTLEELTEFLKQEEIIKKQSRTKKEELRQAVTYEQMNEVFLVKEVHKKIIANREKMSKLIPYKELLKVSKHEEALTAKLSQELTLEERNETSKELEYYKSLVKIFKSEIQVLETGVGSSGSSSSSSGSSSSSSSSYGSSTSSESSSSSSELSSSSSSFYGTSTSSEEVQDLGSTAQEASDI